MNPLRPYRCTVCLESFEHDINLQLHYLSPQHQERARPNLQKTLLGLQATLHGLQDESKSDPSVNLQDVGVSGAHSAGLNLIPDLFEKMNQAHLNQQSNEQLQNQLHHQLNLRLLQQTMEQQSQQIRERAQLNQSEERSERSAESPASFVSKSPQPSSNPSVHPEIEKTLLEALFSSNQTPSEEFIIQLSRESGIDLDKIRSILDQKKTQTSLLPNPKANIMSLASQIGGSRNESLEISKSDASDSVSTKESFSDEESSEHRELKIVENDGQNDSPTSKATSPTSKAQPMSTSSSLTSSSAVGGGTSVLGHHHVQPHAHGQDTIAKPLNSSTHSDNDNSTNRRMRTLISPDQAEVLYREYLEVSWLAGLLGRKIIFEFRTIVHHDSVWKRLQPRPVSRDVLFKYGFKIQEQENEKDNIDLYQCLPKASPQLK